MPISTTRLSDDQFLDLLKRGEGHFLDFKSKAIAPASLTKTLSAFANADGGELYIGIEDKARSRRDHWRGFGKSEEANGHVQALEEFFPLGTYFKYQFLSCDGLPGLLLHCEILKTPDVCRASDERAYCGEAPKIFAARRPKSAPNNSGTAGAAPVQ